MKKAQTFTFVTLSFILGLSGCASNPDKIDATYVSPLKYKEYDCDQIAMEMDYVGDRTNRLYHRLKKERKADNWQTGVGLVLFWPALFFLEGGDGPEAAEYAQLKGEFNALQDASVSRRCGIRARSPEEIMKAAQKGDVPPNAEPSQEFPTVQYSSEANDLADKLDCSEVIAFNGSQGGVEKWRFDCPDGSSISAICQKGSCFVTE